MGHHRNTLISSDERMNKASNTDHNKKIQYFNPEEKFVCHAQVLTNRMDQGRNLGIDISSISTDCDSNIIGCHGNALLTYEGRNKVSNPDTYTYSKPDLYTTQCNKNPYNYPLSLNLNTPSSNFACKDYVTSTILTTDNVSKYIKGIKPVGISRYLHLTPFHKEYYSKQHQGHLFNIIPQNCGTLI